VDAGEEGEVTDLTSETDDYTATVKVNFTIPPTCICSHTLPFHDGAGRCHGTFDVVAVPCACWYFRERGRPYTLHTQPDLSKIVELLERIEYNTRSR
jgi:hypothetical protein